MLWAGSANGNMPMLTAEIGPIVPITLIRCKSLNRRYIGEVWCFIDSIIRQTEYLDRQSTLNQG